MLAESRPMSASSHALAKTGVNSLAALMPRHATGMGLFSHESFSLGVSGITMGQYGLLK